MYAYVYSYVHVCACVCVRTENKNGLMDAWMTGSPLLFSQAGHFLQSENGYDMPSFFLSDLYAK